MSRARHPPPGGSESASRTLYVGNLAPQTRAQDVGHLFEKFGPLARCDIPTPQGISKGYCFVEFYSQNSANKAFSAMQNYVIDGRTIKTEWANEPFRPRSLSPPRRWDSRDRHPLELSPRRRRDFPPRRDFGRNSHREGLHRDAGADPFRDRRDYPPRDGGIRKEDGRREPLGRRDDHPRDSREPASRAEGHPRDRRIRDSNPPHRDHHKRQRYENNHESSPKRHKGREPEESRSQAPSQAAHRSEPPPSPPQNAPLLSQNPPPSPPKAPDTLPKPTEAVSENPEYHRPDDYDQPHYDEGNDDGFRQEPLESLSSSQ